MKQKILDALKLKYNGVDATILNGVAEYLSKTVTTEDQIGAAVEAAEPLTKPLQSEFDRRVSVLTAENKKLKEQGGNELNPDGTPKTKPVEQSKGGDDTPAWAQVLIKKNEDLAAEINAIKAGKTGESRKTVLATKLEKVPEKQKNIILKNFDKMQFASDEEFNSYLGELEADIPGIIQEVSDQGLSGMGKPFTGGGGANPSADAVKSDIQNWAKAQTPVAETK
jgi:hypothetical protein